jgi:hypothetical protein
VTCGGDAPAEIALALAAADDVTDRHQRISRAAELAVERARYEADRAERAFCQVEPENRLVARTLEARWETKLAALAETEQALATSRDARPALPTRLELENLATDLPGLWQAPTTSNKDRKRLLRTLIADVTLLPEIDPTTARIGLRWHTGSCDELVADRPLPPGPAKRSPSPAVELVRQLGPTTDTQDLADKLNAAGLTTGHGHPFDTVAVQWIRHAYHIPAPTPYAHGEISVADAASRLGCSIGVIYDWITTGKLTARRGAGNRLCIRWTNHTEAHCRRRISESGHSIPQPDAPKPAPEPDHTTECRCHQAPWHPTVPPAQHHTNEKIPTRDCRRGSMKSPSRPSRTGSPKRWWPGGWRRRFAADSATTARTPSHSLGVCPRRHANKRPLVRRFVTTAGERHTANDPPGTAAFASAKSLAGSLAAAPWCGEELRYLPHPETMAGRPDGSWRHRT